jgi:hypothetical protein
MRLEPNIPTYPPFSVDYHNCITRDERQWRLAVVDLQAIRANLPNYISEALVNEYHAVLDRMSVGSEEELDSFRIPAAELKPRVTGIQMGSYRGGPGRTNYSKGNYCNSNLFERRIDALTFPPSKKRCASRKCRTTRRTTGR